MLGTTVGHYRVEAEIGAGGMGVVYRARDLMLNRDVALKVVSPGAGDDQTARERLLREARAASALNHPNVCTIHEVEDVGGQQFIVMELVGGRPLSEIIPAAGLPIDRLLGYGRQVADALAHAHERGVLHRDLKSANVVITSDGRAKVLDFGLASQLNRVALDDATRSRVSVTEGGAIAGTLSHLAPEVLSGESPGVASDFWAFGVLLHEMATGALPFRGRSGFEITAAILREPLAPLPTTVSPGLRAIITRCLTKDPGQRYEMLSGNDEAAEAIAVRLIQRDPVFFPARMNLGEILRMRGDIAGAIREQEKILEQDPKNVYAIEKLARAHIQAGDRAAARRALDQTGRADRQNHEVRICWALLLAFEGDRASALKALDAGLLRFAEISPLSTARVAEVYALAGQTDRALDWLDRAVRLGDERLDWFRRNPLLANLRDQPRFSQILDVIAARRAQRRPPSPR